MKCRQARKLMGPFLDGELEERIAAGLERHLETCGGCTRRFSLLRSLMHELSDLPEVVPTRQETIRLLNRLREEMAKPFTVRPSRPRLRVAAVTLSLLAAVSVGVTWSLLAGRKTPSPIVEVTPGGSRSHDLVTRTTGEDLTVSAQDIYPESVEGLVVRPSLVLTKKEYSTSELQAYREDLGSRMAFYSAYWYPISGDVNSPHLPRLQEQLISDLIQQALRAGLNPEELRGALTASLQLAGKTLLPCYVELARVQGKDAWLISLSGPEDYLLFPDPRIPPALHLASRGGEESLRFSESLLKELAGYLLPYGEEFIASSPGLDTAEGRFTQERTPAASDGETAAPDTRVTGEAQQGKRSDEDFQSLLRKLAMQGNSADAIAALQKLNYQQLVMLVQGNWEALASEGVDLSDFLLPPHRLTAVDRSTAEILWRAY